MEEVTVLIIGAGPSGLATSSCLNLNGVPNTVLEKEDCTASLWRNRSYDRLSLHLAKSYCTLPHKSHAPETPAFMSKSHFIDYIDDYVAEHNIEPLYSRCVKSVFFDKASEKWLVHAKNSVSGALERYAARFLVVATGENSEAFTPVLDGIETFKGQTVHSSQYKSGKTYEGKSVLVIGSGNSGMEISDDLSDFNARTCIVVRSDFHVLTKRMVRVGMLMGKWLPMRLVDIFISKVARFHFGDLSRYGIRVPTVHGPFMFKKLTGKTPVIDTGSIEKIKENKIKVVPEVESVNGDYIRFKDGTVQKFDAIVFATGYKNSANKWLKDYKYVLDGEGMPKNKFPNHWKGENGIYCAGLSGNGLPGISSDAAAIAEDIHGILKLEKKSS